MAIEGWIYHIMDDDPMPTPLTFDRSSISIILCVTDICAKRYESHQDKMSKG